MLPQGKMETPALPSYQALLFFRSIDLSVFVIDTLNYALSALYIQTLSVTLTIYRLHKEDQYTTV